VGERAAGTPSPFESSPLWTRACDRMTSWILSNRQWYLVRPNNRSPVSLHVILDPLEPFDACTIGNGRRVALYEAVAHPQRQSSVSCFESTPLGLPGTQTK